MTFFFFSCSNKEKVVIGFMVPTYEITRYVKDRDFFSAKVRELGGDVIVTDAGNDEKKQLEQASELLKQNIDVLVVSAVNQNSAAAIVREAHDYNVKVIAYERMIQNCDLDYFVTFDSEQIGKKMAENVIRLKPSGDYILIGGDKTDKNAILVKQGQLSVIDDLVKSGKIKIPYNGYTEDWSGENAYTELKTILKLSGVEPSVILCSNDGMADGCINALNEFGMKGKVLITGQDADLKACQHIVDGSQTMTVYKPFKKQGETAAILAVKIAKGEKITETNTNVSNGRTEVPSILLEPVAVDISNIKTTVIADGVFKESELYINTNK